MGHYVPSTWLDLSCFPEAWSGPALHMAMNTVFLGHFTMYSSGLYITHNQFKAGPRLSHTSLGGFLGHGGAEEASRRVNAFSTGNSAQSLERKTREFLPSWLIVVFRRNRY